MATASRAASVSACLIAGTCDVLIGCTGTQFVLAEVGNGTTTGGARTLYRQELSYTFERNVLGDASKARQTLLDGGRTSYMTDS